MRKVVRTALFVILAIESVQYIFRAFVFDGDTLKTKLLVILALSLLYFFIKPLLSIVSLPTRGFGYVFITFSLSLIVLYVLSVFVSDFTIHSTTTSDLIIFGFVIPSRSFSGIWAMVVSALGINITYLFLEGLCNKK